MSHPRISARAVIVSNDRVLLVRYRDRAGDWYVLPGGGQQKGETLQECLVREVAEETGLTIDVGSLRWVREFIAANSPESEIAPDFHQVEMFFESRLRGPAEARIGSNPDPGQTGMCWVHPDRLLTMRFYPQEIARILNEQAADRAYLGAVS
jgi:8-oxo-dGTP diphosphatase